MARARCDHEWVRDEELEGFVLRCARCGQYGHLRRTPFGTALRPAAGGINPKKVKPYTCSTSGCGKPAVQRLPGLRSHALYRWACRRHWQGPRPGFRKVGVEEARAAAAAW